MANANGVWVCSVGVALVALVRLKLSLALFNLTELGLPNTISSNTPTMPLYDAHFGGFFVS